MRIAYPVYIEIETPNVIESAENHVTPAAINTEIIPEIPANVVTKPAEVHINWENLAWWMYAGISLLFLLRLLGSFVYSFYLLKTAQQIQWKSNKYYLHPKVKNPMTFASFIFIPGREYLEEHKEQVLIHELIHKKQHHWVDMLLSELVLALCWMNPLVWLYKQCVKNNLEYIADRGVLDTGLQLNTYIQSILCETMGTEAILLANHFQTSQNKQRLKMMKNIKQSRWGKIKLLLILPLTGLILWAFSTPEYIYQQQDNKIINYKELWKDKTDSVKLLFHPPLDTIKVKQMDGSYKQAIIMGEIMHSGVITIKDGQRTSIPVPDEPISLPINIGDTINWKLPGRYPKEIIYSGQEVIYVSSHPKKEITIRGKIITNNGLPNTNIVVEDDNNIGTISDSKGMFELNAYDGAILSFYHPEYNHKKVIYHSGDKLEISLEKKQPISASGNIAISGQVYFADTLFYLQDDGSYKTKILTRPRPQTTISIKGKNISTQSDYYKGYTINIDPNDTLVFSNPGFKTMEVIYSGDKNISPMLLRDDYYYIHEQVRVKEKYLGKTDIPFTKQKMEAENYTPDYTRAHKPNYQYSYETFWIELYSKAAKISQEQKLKGTAYVKFVIDEKGKMESTVPFGNTDQKILDAAEQIVQELNEWYPGYKAGKYRAFTMCVKVEF